MLRNLVSALLEHGKIKTTIAKAKETARLAEKMITLGKRGDDHAKRQAEAFLMNHSKTIPTLFDTYANRYAQRPGGYTRIHRFGNRPGDNAPHAIIELVDGPYDLKFDLTARAVGRETVEQYIVDGDFAKQTPVRPRLSSSSQLRPNTAVNVFKALRYRSEVDRQRFHKKAAEWANRLIAEPRFWNGLKHTVEREPKPTQAEDLPKDESSEAPHDKRVLALEGKTHYAGERLVGTPRGTGRQPNPLSPLAIASGLLGNKKSQPSLFWKRKIGDTDVPT